MGEVTQGLDHGVGLTVFEVLPLVGSGFFGVWTDAFAGKPAPTRDLRHTTYLRLSQIQCGSGLAREGRRPGCQRFTAVGLFSSARLLSKSNTAGYAGRSM